MAAPASTFFFFGGGMGKDIFEAGKTLKKSSVLTTSGGRTLEKSLFLTTLNSKMLFFLISLKVEGGKRGKDIGGGGHLPPRPPLSPPLIIDRGSYWIILRQGYIDSRSCFHIQCNERSVFLWYLVMTLTNHRIWYELITCDYLFVWNR